jgi:hypothetical protein
MLKNLLVATTALMLMSGVGFAQSSYSNTTTESTQVAPATHDVDVTTTTRRTESRRGVMIEKDTTGDEVSRPGAAATSTTTTESSTTR